MYRYVLFVRILDISGHLDISVLNWTSRYSVLDISVLTWTSRYWTVRDLDETIFLTDHNCLVLINCQSLGLFLSFNMWKCDDVTRDVGDT